MINGPKSTDSNITQQSSIINYPERRDQTKIDGPERNAITIYFLLQLMFDQTRGSNHKFSVNTLNSLMVKLVL